MFPFLMCLLLSSGAQANPYSGSVLPQQAAEDPFLWEFKTTGERLEARLIVPPGHRVYREQVNVSVSAQRGVRFKKASYPPGLLRDDPITGGKDREYYDADVLIYVDFNAAKSGESRPLVEVKTRHQGCYKSLCYPAVERSHWVPL